MFKHIKPPDNQHGRDNAMDFGMRVRSLSYMLLRFSKG